MGASPMGASQTGLARLRRSFGFATWLAAGGSPLDEARPNVGKEGGKRFKIAALSLADRGCELKAAFRWPSLSSTSMTDWAGG
eukprot:4313192-Pyramimonas_sp.AAC.3